MRTDKLKHAILALFWLSSLSLIGCSLPENLSDGAEQSEYVEEDTSLDPSSFPAPESTGSDDKPGPVDLSSFADFDTEGGPDPFAEEPAEVSGLLGASRQPTTYLNCYGYIAKAQDGWGRETNEWCQATKLCQADKPKIQAWCNSRGITVSDANSEGFRKAHVRFVEGPRDKWSRDIKYGEKENLYPTYVLTDAQGKEIWHQQGPINTDTLGFIWDVANHQRTKLQVSGNGGGNVRYQCDGKRCWIVRE